MLAAALKCHNNLKISKQKHYSAYTLREYLVQTNLHAKTLCGMCVNEMQCRHFAHFASKLAMKDTQETSMLRKFVKIHTSFAVVIQWSPQVDLASHVIGDMQAF